MASEYSKRNPGPISRRIEIINSCYMVYLYRNQGGLMPDLVGVHVISLNDIPWC